MNRHGFALMAALFVLLIVGGASLDASVRARADRAAAIHAIDAARSRAAAIAAIAEGLDLLQHYANGARAEGLQADEGWLSHVQDHFADDPSLQPSGASFTLDIADVSSRLHLNRVSEEAIRNLLSAHSVEATRADIAAQSIMDWRDRDDLHRARGAEWTDYYAALPRPVRPRNGPFPSVAELQDVRGVDPDLYDTLSRTLTVAGSGRVNVNTASPAVLSAVEGLPDAAVEAILEARSGGVPIRSVPELLERVSGPARTALGADVPGLLSRISFETRIVELRAVGGVPGSNVRHSIQAALAVTDRRVQVVWWREGS